MTETTSLTALLRVDQKARWALGDAVRVENYLLLNPVLERDPEAILELIWNELLLRHEYGDPPQLVEYLRRFGQFEERLPALFQLLNESVVAAPTVGGSLRENSIHAEATSSTATVPGYEIISELGRGGMGVVYEARQSSLKRTVALKMILRDLNADPTVRARFRTEAEAVARLQHPNIVQIYEVGEHDGRPFLSLEFLDGGNLRQLIETTPLSEREAACLVETLANALAHTHQRGILHRDLNPNNVLLTSDGIPKINDFGLAKLLDSDAGMTRTEAFLGTPNYMAPEQAAGLIKQVGAAADVYSLGAILYELLTARPPFTGKTVLAVLDQVRNHDPIPPRHLRASLAPELETICLKCLEKAPRRRYPSAAALAEDLHRFLDGRAIQARPIPLWRRGGRIARRHPFVVAGLLGAVLLISLLFLTRSYLQNREQLASRQAEEHYQRFVNRRNDAHFYGLLRGDQGAQFLGNNASDNLNAAESAAREALALAGVEPETDAAVGLNFPAARRASVAEDSYSLLLLLASMREQQENGQAGEQEGCQEALRLLDRAAKLGFRTRAYHSRRAQVLDRLGRQDEARQERTQAAALPLQGPLDYFLAGEEQFRRGDWDKASASFDGTLSLQADHFWARFFLAICHLKNRQWEAARAGLNACLTQRPEFVWAYLFRSFVNEAVQAWPEAEADFNKAMQLDPNDEARYVLFQTRGILHFNKGDLEHAASDFRSAQALKPAQYNAYLNLAQVCLAQGHFAEADELVNQALRLEPPMPVLYAYHLERGRQLLRIKQYADALVAGDAARKLDPARPQHDELRGYALLALGRCAEAERAIDEFLRKGGVGVSDVYGCRGTARMKLGNFPEAADDYSRAIELTPDATLYQHRAWALFFSDAWKLAARDFSKAIELDPDASDAYTGRGLARVMQGQYREAVADADAALRLEVKSPEMMHNLACIFAQAAARVDNDAGEVDRPMLAEVYRGRAVEAVRQTLKLLPKEQRQSFWREKILPDAALTPIRNDPRFKALFDELVEPGETNGSTSFQIQFFRIPGDLLRKNKLALSKALVQEFVSCNPFLNAASST